MNVNKRKLGDSSELSSFPPGPGTSRNGLPGPPTSLPARPTDSLAPPGTGGAPSGPHADRQRQVPPHLKDRPVPSANVEGVAGVPLASTPGERTRHTGEGTPHSAKRARTEGRRGGRADGNAVGSNATPNRGVGGPVHSTSNEVAEGSQAEASKPVPSLLSRLNPGSVIGKPALVTPERDQIPRDRGQGRRGRADSDRGGQKTVPAKRRAEPLLTPVLSSTPVSLGRPRPRLSPELDQDPVGGLRIRGAAKAAGRSSPTSGDDSGHKGPTSLLQRMQPLGEGNGSFDEGGGRRRKKGRHA
ncbi:hypothetical protein C8Q79DRAFT_792820 [Trametes meyenii]|nr:hypothetical protein C8Q79DRAFT_792820 [Trametes meyenii]